MIGMAVPALKFSFYGTSKNLSGAVSTLYEKSCRIRR